ncbi:DUF2933 domain-containing protein [Legionella sp. PATHC038]|uniref:DUF2933 domain-containing protein n=1 Tax=Legionella sheltonii TaxID=2992041 RepID=UPI002244C3AA|nr:DUF2933 domain-containing protein [Legionella sp. PATHC038]MCW8399446.1 DUF2933 domain-containing protein [Legionella sp. PATHC038]
MNEHKKEAHLREKNHPQNWWFTVPGIVTLFLLLAMGYYLFTEHRAHLFNLLPLLLLLLCPLMHLFMHHGHDHHDHQQNNDKSQQEKD